MSTNNDIILELDQIIKRYKTKGSFLGGGKEDVIALNEVSIKISRGEIFGLVGESGSGKTTTGRLIVKLEDPDGGKISLDGLETTHLKGKALRAFSRRVQMIFQDPYQSLNPQLSIFDTISEPLTIHRVGNIDAKVQAVRRVMRSVGLSPPDEFINRYPHQLSGGQRQRVAIARTMILEPEFVVADEPTSMLDASISAQIFNILLKMRNDYNVTLLFITHSLAAARYLCDRIAVIYRGNLMELGPADQVIHNPVHPYTQALIDALPKFGDCGEIRTYGTLLGVPREESEIEGCLFYPRCGVGERVPCSKDEPLMKEIADSHWVACFNPQAGSREGADGDACYYGV